MNISFRPICGEDLRFLFEVYASTRLDELALTDWSDQQKTEFLNMQFDAQHLYYQENYRDTEFLVILLDEVPVGRLYLARWPDQIRIVDIALLPSYRNVGIGSKILADIIDDSRIQQKPVRIHVECFNPAQNLYRRLGFVPIGEHGVYVLMECSAQMPLSSVSPNNPI
ncbi:MAG: GNAT family N-acetyltransferase [Methylomicrobium sp.]